MKSENIKAINLLICLIFIVVTIAIFSFLGSNKNDSNYVALIFLILSEIMMFITFSLKSRGKNQDKVFIKSGLCSSYIIYFIITSILCLFSSFFINSINILLMVEIILLAILIVLTIIILAISKSD